MTVEELLANEERSMDRPIQMVGSAVIEDVLMVVYDCEPVVVATRGARMFERRFVVVTPGRSTSVTSGIVRTEFEEEAS